MTELDKLIARLGFQCVQYELALVEAQKHIQELEERINTILAPPKDLVKSTQLSEPSPPIVQSDD